MDVNADIQHVNTRHGSTLILVTLIKEHSSIIFILGAATYRITSLTIS